MRPEACAAAREALHVETTDPTPDATVREGEMEGALHVVGERGYRDASVRAILEYSSGHRKQFYDHFASLEDCFQQAYATWIERLGVSLLEAAVVAPGWRAGVRAGLIRLFQFVSEQPSIARSLFVEVHVAGGEALAVHEEASERLAGVLDSVRGEIAPEQAPPEATGVFVVGGVEACLCEVLAVGDQKRIWDALPELMHLAVGSYLGNEAADEEFEEAKALLERDRAELEGGKAMTELRLVTDETEDGPFSAGTPLPRRLPPGRHGIPANLVVEHQRRRLIAALAEALAKHGYANLTTTQVSEGANVSTSTFYKHFGNLWDCALAAYVATADRLCEEIEAACADRDPRSEPLPVGIDAALAFFAAEPALAQLLSTQAPFEATAIGAARRLLISRLAAMLRRGRGPDDAAVQPPGLDERMIDATLVFVGTRISSGKAADLVELGPELTAILDRSRQAA